MSIRRQQETLARARRQSAFLASYARTGVLMVACAAAKVTRETVYLWQRNDDTFAGLMQDAYEDARDRVEHEVVRRAVDGVDKPVFYKGKKIATIKEYSDTLLALLVKQRKASFRDSDKASGGQTNNVTNVSNTLFVPIDRLNDEEFRLLGRIYEKAGPMIVDVPQPAMKAIDGDSGG